MLLGLCNLVECYYACSISKPFEALEGLVKKVYTLTKPSEVLDTMPDLGEVVDKHNIYTQNQASE